MDLYLGGRHATFQRRLASPPAGKVIRTTFAVIKRRLRNQKGRYKASIATPSPQRAGWEAERTEDL